MDVSAWLKGLGLERYEQTFRDNDIEPDVLADLTAEDLVGLGIASLGHRRRLLTAIAALRQPRAVQAAPAGTRSGVAERRQLTVMFCDLVGSTALSASLDPEEMREVIRAYQRAVAEAVARLDGHVAKFMGDGVLAYFGWPHAHEDAAERAVLAGLGAVAAVAQIRGPAGETLAARVGIATGLVVVGDLLGEGAAREEAIIGETPNLAARLQAVARPGEVVISEGVKRLVGGLFLLKSLGMVELKGFAAPVQAYLVRGEAQVESRFDALKGQQLTPLVGRERELGRLLCAWQEACQGHGRTLLLTGEPGIGKSRLAGTVARQVAADGFPVLRYFCSSYHTGTALFPVIGQLQRAAGFEHEDAVPAKLAKLEALLGRATAEPSGLVPLFAALMGLPEDGAYRPPELTPAALKARTLQALLDQLAGLAAQSPVMVLFEDLHWLDPTTAELLVMTCAVVPDLPVLLLATARPEFKPPWPGDAPVETLELARLGRQQSAAVLQQLVGPKGLPEALEADILTKTDGIPLFLEELTKAVLEAGWLADDGNRLELARPLPSLDVPNTLQGSLMARLDRLGGSKSVAQIGAVIGREFDYALLALVADLPRAKLDPALVALEEAALVQRRGTPPRAVYSFKHALVRDAAYESLLRSRRQALHERIVATIESKFEHLAASQPELLAYHCAGAGLTEKAALYWRRAGEQAVRRAANLEGIEHFRRALAQNELLPASEQQARTELAILSQLGPALMSLHGWPAPEVGAAFERAGEVARRLERSADLAPPLVGLWLFHVARGQFDRAETISDELFEIAREHEAPEILLQAHHAAWPTRWLRGRFPAAASHIASGMALYDEGRHDQHRFIYLGHDPAVCGLAIGAPVHWLLGRFEEALDLERRALELARRLRHAPSLAHALWFVGEAQVARRDVVASKATAEELLALCEEHRLPQPRATALMFLGWALARSGNIAAGTKRVEEGLLVWQRLGARSYLPRGLCLLADCHMLAGRHAEGIAVLDQALAVTGETGERWCEARMHQLRGELLLHAHGSSDRAAEACLQTALKVARGQGARAWELGAATVLARLWLESGERQRAHDLLAPIRESLPRGVTAPDLRDAEALLAASG